MKAKFFRRQRKGIAALTVLALLMTVLAVLHKGVPAAQLQLNDGGVWVTNQAMDLVGHLNYPSRTLDGVVLGFSGVPDVSQAANTVLLHDTKLSKVASIDTATQSRGDGASVGDGVTLIQGGQVAVAADAKTGKVWILDPKDADTFNADRDPTLDKLVGVRAIPGTDGVVHLVTPDGSVRKVVDGKAVDDGRIQGLSDLTTASLTVVGDTLVVLDKASSSIRTTKGSVAVSAPDKLVLQMPGPANDRVLLASADSYLWAPLGGGNAVVTPNGKGAGTPAAPAYLDGCGYLAWSGSGAYVRDCANDADDQVKSPSRLVDFKAIAFRVNRDVIVLNDLANGTVLLVNQDMHVVDNWKVINKTKDKQDNNKPSNDPSDPVPSDKHDTNTTPKPKDDDYGVRPGRTVTLPVLENDEDEDGDLLTASVKTQPTGATVSQLRGGEALNIAVPSGATGPYSFTYTADDGRENGAADAKVSVKVFPDSVNEAPVQKRLSKVTVGQKGEVSYSILPDFRDPESDPIYVSGIEDQPIGLQVKWRPDGVITVKDLGTGGAGPREVKVLVSDGTKVSDGGKLMINVASDTLAPVANTDHVMALKDQDVVVHPLPNDVDPMGGQLKLMSVAQTTGLTIEPDYATGVFTVKGSTPGTFYVAYQVNNSSPKSGTGYVRVDVAEPKEGNPVAGDDLAMLPAGGSVVLDPLANDGDPSGGVLVLKSVDVPSTVGMAVEIIDHHLLRISAPVGLKQPVDFTYVVSNGRGQATGRVTVLPLPEAGSATAPVPVNDIATVRLNDIVTIPVLENDVSPSGLPLTIDSKVTIEGDAAAGDAFVSRDVVRFRAKKAGQFRVNYTVRDTASNYATGQVVINVLPLEPLVNQPPQPQPIYGRVLAGSKVTIPVPVNGIDPDGDSVSFVGVSGAQRGVAVATADAIEYTAPAGDDKLGTDTFTYEVADRFGAKKTSIVRVGIAPPNVTNQSPVALPDDVATRPDRALTVNALANDTDPDGDSLVMVKDSVVPTDAQTTAPASINEKNLIKLKTPAEEGVLHYFYGVTDGRGGSAKGVVTIKVSKDAVLKAPVARDDVVTEAQIKDKTSVEVDVLANDYDPDGSVDDLTVSSDDPGVTAPNGKLTIPVTEQRQVVLYTVKDLDGNIAKAAVVVPPSTQGAPYIDETKVPLKVKAGELLAIPLADVVIVRAGRAPMITFAAKVTAGPGADTTELVKDAHTLQFQAVKDFTGLSSVNVEVTDGTTPEDQAGKTATLTVPILVEAAAAEKHQPVFHGSDVTAGAGEPATVVDLKQMTTDVDPGDMDKLTFELGQLPAGFTVTRAGSKLSVSAPIDAKAGATATLPLTVTDQSTPVVAGTVLLKATASTKPLMAIKTAVVNDAKAGFPSTVDLSGYITNPIPGSPVTIVSHSESGSVAGTVAPPNGLVVTITPAANQNGQMLVTYTAQDGTGDPSRRVQGTIELTVRDKPAPPTAVTATTNLSKTATVLWTPGASNGAQIDKYTVRWSGGSKDCVQVTNCLIDTLTNNTPYTFTVTATNAVGESLPSDPSNQVRPDVKPDPPGTPVGTFGDKQITVDWAKAVVPDNGSAVTEYTVLISGSGFTGSNTKVVTTNTVTWTGLTNGNSYTFQVQAKNGAPDPSGWSGTSASVIPAGLPFAPAAPNAAKDKASTMAPSATITWTAPNGNGDSKLTYEMRRTGTSTVLYTGTGLQQHVTMTVETTNQTFEVRAQNKAGWGPWSPASNGIRGLQTPGSVTGLDVQPTGVNNQVTISFGAAAGNGAAASEMTYYWKAGGSQGSIKAGGDTVTSGALVNGQSVAVSVWADSTVNGETVSGTPLSKNVNAYGPPTAPNVNDCSSQYLSVICSWSGGSDGGRSTSFYLQQGGSGNVPASGTFTIPSGAGDMQYLQVCASQTMENGSSRSVCGNTGANRAWDAPGEYYRNSGVAVPNKAGWYYVDMNLQRWRPGSTVRCSISGVNAGNWAQDFNIDGNGNWAWARAPGGLAWGPGENPDTFTWGGNCR